METAALSALRGGAELSGTDRDLGPTAGVRVQGGRVEPEACSPREAAHRAQSKRRVGEGGVRCAPVGPFSFSCSSPWPWAPYPDSSPAAPPPARGPEPCGGRGRRSSPAGPSRVGASPRRERTAGSSSPACRTRTRTTSTPARSRSPATRRTGASSGRATGAVWASPRPPKGSPWTGAAPCTCSRPISTDSARSGRRTSQ
jgi:hypothetical protein